MNTEFRSNKPRAAWNGMKKILCYERGNKVVRLDGLNSDA